MAKVTVWGLAPVLQAFCRDWGKEVRGGSWRKPTSLEVMEGSLAGHSKQSVGGSSILTDCLFVL